MKKALFLSLLFFVPSLTRCFSYRQCVTEFQTMRSQLELKKEECEQTKINMENEFKIKMNELIAVQSEELNELQQRHLTERDQLKGEYEQED